MRRRGLFKGAEVVIAANPICGDSQIVVMSGRMSSALCHACIAVDLVSAPDEVF